MNNGGNLSKQSKYDHFKNEIYRGIVEQIMNGKRFVTIDIEDIKLDSQSKERAVNEATSDLDKNGLFYILRIVENKEPDLPKSEKLIKYAAGKMKKDYLPDQNYFKSEKYIFSKAVLESSLQKGYIRQDEYKAITESNKKWHIDKNLFRSVSEGGNKIMKKITNNYDVKLNNASSISKILLMAEDEKRKSRASSIVKKIEQGDILNGEYVKRVSSNMQNIISSKMDLVNTDQGKKINAGALFLEKFYDICQLTSEVRSQETWDKNNKNIQSAADFLNNYKKEYPSNPFANELDHAEGLIKKHNEKFNDYFIKKNGQETKKFCEDFEGSIANLPQRNSESRLTKEQKKSSNWLNCLSGTGGSRAPFYR